MARGSQAAVFAADSVPLDQRPVALGVVVVGRGWQGSVRGAATTTPTTATRRRKHAAPGRGRRRRLVVLVRLGQHSQSTGQWLRRVAGQQRAVVPRPIVRLFRFRVRVGALDRIQRVDRLTDAAARMVVVIVVIVIAVGGTTANPGLTTSAGLLLRELGKRLLLGL